MCQVAMSKLQYLPKGQVQSLAGGGRAVKIKWESSSKITGYVSASKERWWEGVTRQAATVQLSSCAGRFHLIKSSKPPLERMGPSEDEDSKTIRVKQLACGYWDLKPSVLKFKRSHPINPACCFPGRVRKCQQI